MLLLSRNRVPRLAGEGEWAFVRKFSRQGLLQSLVPTKLGLVSYPSNPWVPRCWLGPQESTRSAPSGLQPSLSGFRVSGTVTNDLTALCLSFPSADAALPSPGWLESKGGWIVKHVPGLPAQPGPAGIPAWNPLVLRRQTLGKQAGVMGVGAGLRA